MPSDASSVSRAVLEGEEAQRERADQRATGRLGAERIQATKAPECSGLSEPTSLSWQPGRMDEPADRRVVVAGILRRAGSVLLAHRAPNRRWYPDSWDLPGGHVRDGEQPREALVRELREELGIEVTLPAEPVAHVRGVDFRMDIWVINTWSGEPSNVAPGEHDALAWVDQEQAHGLKLADPRLLILLQDALTQH